MAFSLFPASLIRTVRNEDQLRRHTYLQLGDEIFADATVGVGSLAEYVAVNESCVALKPRNVSFAEVRFLLCLQGT